MHADHGTAKNSRTFDTVERRELELLKHEVARLRGETRTARILAGIAALGFGLGLVAMKNPEIAPLVQTKRLEIVDDSGRVALVATGSRQGGRLDFWNASGANTARLGSNDLGGDLILWDKSGHAMVSAYAQDSGGRLEIGAGGDKVVGVFESAQTGARLSLANRAGNPLVAAGAFEDGGAVRLADRDNKDAAVLQATANGGSLGLVAPGGVTMARLRAGEAGGELDLAAKSGPQRVSASAGEKESVVIALSAVGASKLEAGSAGGSSEILSKDGERLASLEANAAGGVLVCRTGGDRAVASIGANPTIAKGGLMQLYNEKSNPIFAAAVNAEGAGRLALGTAEGAATIVAESGKDDGGSVSLSRSGRRALALVAGSSGGLLNLFSGSGVPLVVAGAAEDAAGGAVIVRSTEGKDLVRVGVDEKGSGNVTLFNKDSSERKVVAGPR